MSETKGNQPAPAPAPRNLLRRVLALALLGSAAAMAIVQVVNSIRHDALIRLDLSPELAAELSRMEIAVLAEGEATEPVSVIVFRFDADHRPAAPLEHELQLPNGRYELMFELFRKDDPRPVRARHRLEVAGDVTVRYGLP